MREIEILNSNFKLVQVPIDPGGKVYITDRDRSQLLYKEVIVINGTLVSTRRLLGQNQVNVVLHRNKIPSSTAWVISKTSGKKFKEVVEFEQDDIIVLLNFIRQNCLKRIAFTDLLVNTLADRGVYEKWRQTYGISKLADFRQYVVRIIEDPVPYKINYIKLEAIHPVENKYSVQDFLDDLEKDRAEVLLDKELIGEYQKISTSNRTIPEEVKILNQEWSPIVEILGNKTRANLSIRNKLKVNVPIPKNPYISETEMECFTDSSLCIVRDGVLWMKNLGVRVSPKLAGKFKRLGIVKMPLLCKNDYLIDLSSLPICKKKEVSSYELANLEIGLLVSKICLEYIKYSEKCEEDKKEIDPKERFLNSLGIFGDQYYPTTRNHSKPGKYEVTECVASFHNLPKTAIERRQYFERYKNKHDSISLFSKILDLVETKSQEEWLKEYRTSQRKLREAKFHLMMSRLMEFSDTRRSAIHHWVPIYFGKVSSDKCVRVSWDIRKREVSYDKQ